MPHTRFPRTPSTFTGLLTIALLLGGCDDLSLDDNQPTTGETDGTNPGDRTPIQTRQNKRTLIGLIERRDDFRTRRNITADLGHLPPNASK